MDDQSPTITDYRSLSISDIADAIRKHWKSVNFAARPYLDAMQSMDSIKDNYGSDPGYMIVSYFLGNATQFKGPEAKAIKAELNRRLKSKSAKIVSANQGDQGMLKIASPDELATELHGLLAYANTPNPSRAKIAETLTSLATRVRTAKLMSRQEKILKDYLASAGSKAVMEYEDLPSSVKDALTRVKDQETLDSDVNRWLMDNNIAARKWGSDRVGSTVPSAVMRLIWAIKQKSPRRLVWGPSQVGVQFPNESSANNFEDRAKGALGLDDDSDAEDDVRDPFPNNDNPYMVVGTQDPKPPHNYTITISW